MNLAWIAPEVMQRFAGSLLHFIWQGAVIAIFAAIGLRLLRDRSAEVRYGFAIIAMTCMLAAPMLTLAFYAQTGAIAQRLIQAVSQASSGSQTLETTLWAQRIFVAWSVGVIAFAVRLTVGWRLSWQLVKSAEEIVAPGVTKIFESVRERLGLRTPIRLLSHGGLDSPVVVGWLRPVVLMPITLLTGLSEDQLVAMLAHELAHIRRHDYMVNILQRCVESILFYHPAVWWLSKRIRAEREHCCDDIAVRICGSRKLYAEALIELERARQTRPLLAVAGADGVVLQRFRRVLGLRSSAFDWQSAVGTLMFVGIWIVVGMWQSSSTLQARPIQPPARLPAVSPAIFPSPAPAAESLQAIAAILTAQPTAPAPQAAARSGKGTIQGVVTRAGSSEPIPGATVAIINAPYDPDALKELLGYWAARGVTMKPPEPGQSDEKYMELLQDTIRASGRGGGNVPNNQLALQQFRDANTARSSVVADANGRFAIKDLPPGKYSVEAGREGFFPGTGDKVITEVEADKAAPIVIPLSPGGTITGRVKNAAGKAQANVTVTAHAITYQNGKIYPEAMSSQTTDDRGEYRLYWLPPGEYIVVADPPRYPITAPQPQNGPVAIGPGGQQAPPLLSTPRFARTFYPKSPNTDDSRTITIKGGEQLSGMDITLEKSLTYKIAGEIHAVATRAAQGARGEARGANANVNPNIPPTLLVLIGIEYRNPSVIDMRSTTLGGTVPSIATATLTPSGDGFRGRFEVPEVLPGEYYLVPRINDLSPAGVGAGQGAMVNRIPVDVRDRDITDLVMEMFTRPTITGTVMIDGHAPADVPVRITLHADGNPSPIYQGFGTRPITVRADDGTFTANAQPARFRVQAAPGLPPNLYVSDVRQGAASIFDSGFVVGKESTAPLQVLLRSGAATVQGVVRDTSGKPVPNATVVVIPPDIRRDNHELYKLSTSDATGRFTVQGIAPGSYKIFAWQGLEGGEFYNSRFLSKYEFRGRSINLAQGSTITESLTVIDNN